MYEQQAARVSCLAIQAWCGRPVADGARVRAGGLGPNLQHASAKEEAGPAACCNRVDVQLGWLGLSHLQPPICPPRPQLGTQATSRQPAHNMALTRGGTFKHVLVAASEARHISRGPTHVKADDLQLAGIQSLPACGQRIPHVPARHACQQSQHTMSTTRLLSRRLLTRLQDQREWPCAQRKTRQGSSPRQTA